jgi:divalent metal cation (Fe/Co/Zn/Cd) transporter
VILIAVAIVLAFENYSLIIGQAAPERLEQRIRDAVARDDAVRALAALHTMHVGPQSILAVIAVAFSPDLETPQIEAAVRRLQDRVKNAVAGDTDARLVVIEPASADGSTFGRVA